MIRDILEQNGVKIKHYFSDGIYIKETHIPKGIELTQHVHSYSHLSVLVSGKATVSIAGEDTDYEGYCTLNIEKGKKHKVKAITPVVWLCIHATDDKNPETVDISLMSKIVK